MDYPLPLPTSPSLDISFYACLDVIATEWQGSDNRGDSRLYGHFTELSMVEGAYKCAHTHILVKPFNRVNVKYP